MIDLEAIVKSYENKDPDDKLKESELCMLFREYGSDKSMPLDFEENKKQYASDCEKKIRCLHNYSNFYHELFQSIKDDKLVFFEMGVGSRNENIDSNMTHMNYSDDLAIGCSLRAWSEYFKNSKIYGADIDPSLVFEEKEKRIKTFQCDQNSKEDFLEVMKYINEPIDIIVDDGRHTPEANLKFFESSFEHLKKGGIYVIEDVMLTGEREMKHKKNMKHFESKASYVALVKLDNTFNTRDNNLIVIKK